MTLTLNFNIEEFVPPHVFKQFGASSTWFLQKAHVDSIQWLRTRLGVQLIINNWAQGGQFKNRGLRTPESQLYKPYSQHSFGNASDQHSPEMSVQEMYKWVLDNQDEVLAKTSIRAVEDIADTPTWLHLDSRYTPNAKSLLIVKP